MVGMRSICGEELEYLTADWATMLGSLLNSEPDQVVLYESVVPALTADKSVVRHRRHYHWILLSSEGTIQGSLSEVFLLRIETFPHSVVQFFSHFVSNITVNTGNLVVITGLFSRLIRVLCDVFLLFSHIFRNTD